jgi:hypothetical protein
MWGDMDLSGGGIIMRGNWYLWIILLGFGWTIAGGITGVLVSQLGFPYIWVTPLTLAMIGTVGFLAYRGYAAPGWILAACIGFILITVMAILRAVTVPDPNIPDVYRREFEEADQSTSFMGIDIPMYYDEGMGDYYIEYTPGQTDYLVLQGYGYRVPVTVEFPTLDTAGGQWAFESGMMRLRGAVSDNVEANPELNGSGDVTFEPDQALRKAYPELTADVRLPSNTSRGPMEVHAEMVVTYPLPDGAVERSTLTRDFTLNIIGDDYYSYYQRYFDWERSRSVVETPIWIALVIGSVIAGGVSVYLIRQGAHKMYSTGGLSMVVRRLSGTQKLGAEVLPLDRYDQFRDQTAGVEQGVFVGRVNAQSPAGRAGFRTGDVLIEFAGKAVNSPRAVNQSAKNRQRGEVVDAVVLRDGARVELRVRF